MNQKQKTIKVYQDKKGMKVFDKASNRFPFQKYRYKIEANFLKKIIGQYKGNLKILDAACGTGRFLPIVFNTKKNIKYTGLDTSKAMFFYLKKKKLFSDNKKNISLVLSDAARMPFRDNTFDIIYTYHFLWHIPQENQKEAITEMMRVLKKGGTLIFDITNKRFIWRRFKDIFGAKETPNVYKLGLSEVKKIVRRERIDVEKLLDFPIKNNFLYSLFNIFNYFRKFFPPIMFHMLFIAVKK